MASQSTNSFKIVADPKEIEQGMFKIFFTMEKDTKDQVRRSLNAVAKDLADNVRSVFELGGARGGNPKWIIRPQGNPTPLRDRGFLEESVIGVSSEQGTTFVVTIGTNLPYGEINHEGGNVNTDVVWAGKDNRLTGWEHTGFFRDMEITKRPWLFTTEEDHEMFENALFSGIEVLDFGKLV